MNTDAERVLAAAPEATGELARKTCDLILAIFPDAVVTADGTDVGFGTGAGYKGLVFVVTAHRAHVTLGISHGVGLPDPAGLMAGTGRVHRHVKIHDVPDLERPELVDLMTVALAARRAG